MLIWLCSAAFVCQLAADSQIKKKLKYKFSTLTNIENLWIVKRWLSISDNGSTFSGNRKVILVTDTKTKQSKTKTTRSVESFLNVFIE